MAQDYIGAADALLGNHPGAPLPQGAAEGPSMLGEASKGFSRGLRSMGANAEQLGGLGAEAFGAPDLAKQLYGGAQSLRQAAQAPQFAAEAPTWDAAHGVGQSVRWVMGKAGEMVPIMGAAGLGELAAGPVGAGAMMMPDMAGAIATEQQQNPAINAQPAGQRLGRALGYGGLASAATMLPVGGALSKMVGGGAATRSLAGAVARNVGEGAATGYAGMAGADMATQQGVDPNATIDLSRANEAGLGGAVAMGVMHAPGAVGSYARGAGEGIAQSVGDAAGSVKKLWGSKLAEAQAAAEPAMDAVAESGPAKKINSFWDDTKELLASGKKNTEDVAGKIMRGEPVGIDAQAFATATGEQASQMYDAATSAADAWLKKQGVDMSTVTDDVSRKAAAAKLYAQDKAGKVGDAISEFVDGFKSAKDDGTKKSEDYTPIHKAILSGLQESGLFESRPELFEGRNQGELVKGLRMYLDQFSKGPVTAKTNARLTSLLGKDAVPLLNAIKGHLGEFSQDELRNQMGNLVMANKAHQTQGSLRDKLSTLLQPEVRSNMQDRDFTKLVSYMRGLANGDHMNSPEAKALAATDGDARPSGDAAGQNAQALKDYDQMVMSHAMDALKTHFGDRADAALALVQKDTAQPKGKVVAEDPDPTNEHGAILDVDSSDEGNKTPKKVKRDQDGNVLQDSPPDTARFGLGKPDKNGKMKVVANGTEMLSPEAHNASTDPNKGYNHAQQAMWDLQRDYPTEHGTEPAKDANGNLIIDAGGRVVMQKGDPKVQGGYEVRFEHGVNKDGTKSDRGHVVVENHGNVGAFSVADLEDMRHDTHNYSTSDSAIKIGDKTFDATKVAKVMGKREGRNGDTNLQGVQGAERTALLFKKGIGELMAHQGKIVDIPDTLRIGGTAENPIHWGDAKKMNSARAEDRSDGKGLDREEQARLDYLRKVEMQGTRSGAELAKIGLKSIALSTDDRVAIRNEIEHLEGMAEESRSKELLAGSQTENARARSSRRQAALGERNAKMLGQNTDTKGVYAEHDSRFDKEGNITAGGLAEHLGGGQHGGIYREHGEASVHGGSAGEQYPARQRSGMVNDKMENPSTRNWEGVDQGRGATTLGKDEQVHLQFAGRDEPPLFANAENMGVGNGRDLMESWGAQDRSNGQNVNRGNMDGSAHSTYAGRELRVTHLADTLDAWQKNAKTPGAKELMRKANILYDNFSKMSEEDRRRFLQTAGTPAEFGADSGISYPDIDTANMSTMKHIDGLSDVQARTELFNRQRKWKAIEGQHDKYMNRFRQAIEEEMDGLMDRLENGSKGGVKGQKTLAQGSKMINALFERYDAVNNPPGERGESVVASKGNVPEKGATFAKRDKPKFGPDYQHTTEADMAEEKLRVNDQRMERAAQHAAEARRRLSQPADIADVAELARRKAHDARQAELEGAFRGTALNGDTPARDADKGGMGVWRGAAATPGESAKRVPGATMAEKAARLQEGLGGKPNPKELAAKKAALLQAASSSNPALHEQLRTSTDVSSLRRTVLHLASIAKPDAGTLKTIEVANKRLGELISRSEDAGYGAQLKYSLIKVDPERAAAYDKSPFDTRLYHYTSDHRLLRIGDEGYDNTQHPVHNMKGQDGRGIEGNAKDAHWFTNRGPDTNENKYLEGSRWSHGKNRDVDGNDAGERLGHAEASLDPNAKIFDLTPKTHKEWVAKLGAERRAHVESYAAETNMLKRYDAEREFDKKFAYLGREFGEYREIIKRIRAEGYDGIHVQGHESYSLRSDLGDSRNGDHIIFNPDKVALSKGYVSGGERLFSKDANKNTGTAADAAKRTAVEAEIKRIAPKVSVAWKGLSDMAYAGDYNHQLKAIRLSVAALNPMSTGYHEALHHFLASMRDAGAHDVAEVLEKAAQQQHVIEQLHEIYKGNADVLKQLADPEERAAYMFQHWAMDKTFQVSMKANTVFGKIKAFINNLLGNWTNSERALHIMEYFHSGEYAANADRPSAVRRALMNVNKNEVYENAKGAASRLGELADTIVSAGSARLHDSGNQALGELATLIKRRATDASGGDRGLVPMTRMLTSNKIREFGERLGPDLTPEGMKAALEFLQSGKMPLSGTPESRLAARMLANKVKATLRETRDYMVEAGVKVGDLGPDYFHRVWDTEYIGQNQQAFRDMLEPYIRSGKMKGTADQLLANLIRHGGTEMGIPDESYETPQPGMQATKHRQLDFIDPRDAAEFQNKDLLGTVNSYITQAVRKAEWTRRLGSGKLEAIMDKAEKQGATKDQLHGAEQFLKGIDGTLGDDISATQRRLTGNMIVYQNVRLLPMASFSMMIDPLGTVVRGAKLGEAWSTFTRGMKGITKSWSADGGELGDKQTKWAELVGVVDSAMMSHAMGDAFTQGMVGGTAKTINDTFFKYNLVEGLNRNFRIGATESAMKFIQRHGPGTESAHSGRWIKELGLDAADIKTTKDGDLALTEADGLSKAQVTKVHAAINQWVDGAILRPDAADKPVWMNDPHYALIAHLKQFTYAFQHTILERVTHEFKNGNYTPMMALASYVPVMLAADFAKGALQNGGGTPDWQQGWDLADYIEYAVERSGIYGVGQIGIEALKGARHGGAGYLASLGPTVEQLGQGVEAVGGKGQFGQFALKSMPAHALYDHLIGNPTGADPTIPD